MKLLRDRKTSKMKLWIQENWVGDIQAVDKHAKRHLPSSSGWKEVPNFEFSAELRMVKPRYGGYTINLEVIDPNLPASLTLQMEPYNFQVVVELAKNNEQGFSLIPGELFAFSGNFFFDFSGRSMTINPVYKA